MDNEINNYVGVIYWNFVNRYVGDGVAADWVEEQNRIFNRDLKVTIGKVYAKVVCGGSVHSFIVLNTGPKFQKGDILKASSANAPAKNYARGNVFNYESYQNVSWVGA
jgi:hypothetical protein